MNKYFRYSIILFSAVFLFFIIVIFVFKNTPTAINADTLQLDDQEATIRAINQVSPAVVSISVIETVERQSSLGNGGTISTTEKQNRGMGSGFLISSDGLILTNRHVANVTKRDKAEYKITLNSGKQYYAQFIGNDPLNDLAVLKIFDNNLPFVKLGDSNKLTVGTTVIAIGNSLGRYSNSATKGIVSGLYRTLSASGNNGETEDLKNVIQTDAEINVGNSGGPLVDLNGTVVGINVAKDQSGDSIGFSIPINEAKPIIISARNQGRIVRARVGVRFAMITPEMAEEKKLARTSGALLVDSEHGDSSITAGGPAEKVGLQTGDIIFEIDGRTIDERMPLSSYINQFTCKKIGLRVQRGQQIFSKVVTLDEFK